MVLAIVQYSNMDTIRMPYGEIQQYNTTDMYGYNMDAIWRNTTIHQNASSFLVQSTTCFLVDSTILRRKYKDQTFNFTNIKFFLNAILAYYITFPEFRMLYR